MSKAPVDKARLVAELGKRLLETEERAAALRAEIEEIRGELAELLQLRESTDDRSISSVDVDMRGRSTSAKRGAAHARRDHAAQKILYGAGVTITALAKAMGESRSRVTSWMGTTPSDLRPVPRYAVKAMAAGIDVVIQDHGKPPRKVRVVIPASVWTHVAD